MVEVEPTVVYEQIILNINECFFYKVPPMRIASGHRAEDWNLATPLLTGYLRLYQVSRTVPHANEEQIDISLPRPILSCEYACIPTKIRPQWLQQTRI